MNESLSQQDYRLLFELRRSLRHFLRFSEEAARAAGLEPQQHQAMLAIRANEDDGPVRVGDVADWLQLRHHSAVGLLNRLVQRGLVERERDGHDRRFVNVRLTSEGERILEELSLHHRAELRRAAPALSRVLAQIAGAHQPSEAAREALQRETSATEQA